MTWSPVGRPSADTFPLIQLAVVHALLFGLLFWFAGWDRGLFALFLGLNVMPIVTDWWEHRKNAADPFGGLMR